MQPLSVVIITLNAEPTIAEAVDSAAFADEVLVVDCGSTDKTYKIATTHGAKVIHQDWLGYGAQKNKAISLASHDWVFVLDADERIPPPLREEIIITLKTPTADGYEVARINHFFGKIIKTCGLYPDYTLRLFNRTKTQFDNTSVHERAHTKGKITKLKYPMRHLAYQTIEAFINKQNHYSTLQHKKPNALKAVFAPSWTFFRLYIIKLGFLDGWHGFIIAKLYAQYTFWKYTKGLFNPPHHPHKTPKSPPPPPKS